MYSIALKTTNVLMLVIFNFQGTKGNYLPINAHHLMCIDRLTTDLSWARVRREKPCPLSH